VSRRSPRGTRKRGTDTTFNGLVGITVEGLGSGLETDDNAERIFQDDKANRRGSETCCSRTRLVYSRRGENVVTRHGFARESGMTASFLSPTSLTGAISVGSRERSG
jgi:hypothetical protein